MATLAILFSVSTHCNAQALNNLLGGVEKIVNNATGKSNVDLKGSWSYTGSAVEFETENLLMKAGGSVAASATEAKMDAQLKKMGIQPGQMSFTFNADSTFNTKVGTKTYTGTYSYNKSQKKVTLTFLKIFEFGAKVNYSSNNMDLLFDSNKLLKLLVFLGSKSSNTSIKTVSSLASSYDGMMLGFSLKKK
jgi:hypothetical protein